MENAFRNSVIGKSSDFPILPPKDLHICYIQGQVKSCDNIFARNFIGNWEEDGFSFLFFSEPASVEVERLLQMQPELILLDQFYMSYEEWQGGRVKPFTVGNFFVRPPWEECSKPEDLNSKFEIVLDPGVVFGTGTHPTTHDCLEMLELACDKRKTDRVIDLGTGTGLLALAAARLGCRQVLALDFNFLAAQTARRNVALNQLENRILVFQARAQDFMQCNADLVIANIHYDVMKDLILSEGFLHKKHFILSGLLRSEARDIEYKLSQYPVKILEKREHEGIWHTFFGVCA